MLVIDFETACGMWNVKWWSMQLSWMKHAEFFQEREMDYNRIGTKCAPKLKSRPNCGGGMYSCMKKSLRIPCRLENLLSKICKNLLFLAAASNLLWFPEKYDTGTWESFDEKSSQWMLIDNGQNVADFEIVRGLPRSGQVKSSGIVLDHVFCAGLGGDVPLRHSLDLHAFLTLCWHSSWNFSWLVLQQAWRVLLS